MADPLLVSPKEFIAAVTGKWDIQGIPMVVSVWPTSEEELKDVLQKLSDSAALNSVPIGWVKKKEWVGLTDEDTSIAFDSMRFADDYETYAEVIEAKLKEKNAC